MVIPLMKQAEDEQGTDGQPALGCSVSWADGAARATDARRTLRAFLAHALPAGPRLLSSHLGIDAELVVSELVTNAIRYAPGPCAMTLRLSGGELTISVWDTSADAPRAEERDPRRVGGHGLHLVHAVSDRIDITACETGKRITAHLRLPPAPAPQPTRTVLSGFLPGRSPLQRSGTETEGPGRHSDAPPRGH